MLRSATIPVTVIGLTTLGSAALATTLTFDDVGFTGNTGTFAGDVYQASGALLSTDGVAPLTYFVHGEVGIISHSQPYSVGVGNGGSPFLFGNVRIDFVIPGTTTPTTVSAVSVWAGDASAETETVTLDAYDSEGNLVATDSFVTGFQPGNLPVEGQLNVAPPGGTAYVVIGSTHVVSFDDVEFSQVATSVGVGSVEQSPWGRVKFLYR